MTMDDTLATMDRFDGWFFSDEARLLYGSTLEAVKKSAGAIVEIGSFMGRSTTVLGRAALEARPGSKVYAVDPHLGNLSGVKMPETYERFLANMKAAGLEKVVVPIRKASTEVEWNQDIAVLFIDGLHDYDSVAADYQHFSKFVEPGGIVAFHDYTNPDHPGVRKFVDEKVLNGELVILGLPEKPRKEASLIITKKRATFSIIIPTKGRVTLRRTLDSIVWAGIGPHDEVIVVGDGPQPVAKHIVENFKSINIRYVDGELTHGYGGRQRNLGMFLAGKTHLAFIDDDDVYVPGALYYMREAAEEHLGKFILFREEEHRVHVKWGIVWQQKVLKYANVGTQMIVCPNTKHQLGTWGDKQGSDWTFIRGTVDRWPGGEDGIVWIDRVIAYLY